MSYAYKNIKKINFNLTHLIKLNRLNISSLTSTLSDQYLISDTKILTNVHKAHI
jgi:hypothetical protein